MVNIASIIDSHCLTIQGLAALIPLLETLGEDMVGILRGGGKILFIGNGGSAADAQHLAAELVGRFQRQRRAYAALALTTDSSILTAVANDYSYDSVFTRQIEALCRPEDMLFAISTSGNSANIIAAVAAAAKIGAVTIGLSGRDGGRLAKIASSCLTVPGTSTARIQEAHILIGHILCQWVEDALEADDHAV